MTKIKQLIGEGITDSMNLAGGDLGVMRYDPMRQCIVAILGDNFSEPFLGGTWRGPSLLCFDENYDPIGIPTTAGPGSWPSRGLNQPIGQLWYVPHSVDPPFTVLPTDFIYVNQKWWVSAFSAAGLPNPQTTEFHSSLDLSIWAEESQQTIEHDSQSHPGKVMLTFEDGDDGYVYIFGTGGLQRTQPIWLWRCHTQTFPTLTDWEPYHYDSDHGWYWEEPGSPMVQMPALRGQFGELNLRRVEDKFVLSFFDRANYCVSALLLDHPTDSLYRAEKITMAVGEAPSNVILDTPLTVIPQLYAPYISPFSKLTDMRFAVSQWDTATNDPYTIWLVSSSFPEESQENQQGVDTSQADHRGEG